MDSTAENASAPSGAGATAIYFDGKSSRRRPVTLAFRDRLELRESPEEATEWSYDDIRRADSPPGTLRVTCLTAPALARLEIRDVAVAAELVSRCAHLDDNVPGRHGVAAIIGWSVAAAVSIVAVVLFGVPLAADRLTPLVPQAFEQRLGEVADRQIKAMFDGKVCANAAGQAALVKLVDRVGNRPGSTRPSEPPCSRRRFPTLSRCPAARFMCSTVCWRGRKIRTRSPACWRTSSAI